MDIRRFFSPTNKTTSPTTPKETKNKRKLVVLESDDEDPIPSTPKTDKSKKLSVKSLPKKSKATAHGNKSLKPISAADFFSTQPTRKERPKTNKPDRCNEVINIDSDEDDIKDFQATLDQLDSQTAKNQRKNYSKSTSKDSSSLGLAEKLSKKISESKDILNDKSSSNIDKNGEKCKVIDAKKREKSTKHNGQSKHRSDRTPTKTQTTPNKIDHKRTPSKDHIKETSDNEKTPTKRKEDLQICPVKIKTKKTPTKTNKNKSPVKYKSERTFVKNKDKTPAKPKTERTPVKNNEERYNENTKKNGSRSKYDLTPVKKRNGSTELCKTPAEEDKDKMNIDSADKKKKSVMAYHKYLQRSGPKNPGSKIIPEGSPDCLKGVTIVLTGVLDSMDREEVTELIKKYGGKVTTSVSKNTTYLLVGDEPGESKMKKGDQLGTKRLDEDSLLELIAKSAPNKTDINYKGGINCGNQVSRSSPSPKTKAIHSQKRSLPEQSTPPAKRLHLTDSPKGRLVNSPLSQSQSSSTSSMSSTTLSPQRSQEIKPFVSANDSESQSLLWVDKYSPKSLKAIIGQQGDRSNARKLYNWLKNWFHNYALPSSQKPNSFFTKDETGKSFKAALLSGPPGVGKTTSSHVVCKELGFDVVELNASDARSKKTLEQHLAELISSKSLAGFASKGSSALPTSASHVLLMDEVDGMSGNEDRGGVQELIALIKASKTPIICMCNDRNHPKIRSLANHCFDLRFAKPRIEQIRGAMMTVCFKEGLKIKPDALDQVILGSNQDIRQVLNHLSLWSSDQKQLATDDLKKEAQKAKKNLRLGPWDVCQAVFNESSQKQKNIHEKSDLFFHDYSIAPLFVQENYLKVNPHVARGNRRCLLQQLSLTANSIADGDLVDKTIRNGNNWALLPSQALFSSVLPGHYMSGHFSSQIEFPKWLGQNSRKNKFDRLSQELHTHVRLRVSGTKRDVGVDYSGLLRKAVIDPLISAGAQGVQDSVKVMTSYDLIREDLDSIMELSMWPNMRDPMTGIESKVKAAFTRTLNKDSHMTPYSVVAVKKGRGKRVGGEEEWGEEEEYEEEYDEDDDINKDAMIKKGKGNNNKSTETKGGGKGKGKKKKN